MGKIPWDENVFNITGKNNKKVAQFNPERVDDKYLDLVVKEGIFDFPIGTHFAEWIDRTFRGSSGVAGKGGEGDTELSRMLLRTAVGEGAKLPNVPGAINIPDEIRMQLTLEPSKIDRRRSTKQLATEFNIIKKWVEQNGEKVQRGHALSISWAFIFAVATKRKPFPVAPLIYAGQRNIGAFAQTEKANLGQSAQELQEVEILRKAVKARDFYGLIKMTKMQDSRHAFWAMVLPISDPDTALQGIRDSAINQMKVDTGFLRENSRAEFNRPDINTAGNLDFFIPEERRMLDPDRYYPDNTSTLADMTMRGLQSWANQQIDDRFIKPELLEILFNIRTNFYPVGDV